MAGSDYYSVARPIVPSDTVDQPPQAQGFGPVGLTDAVYVGGAGVVAAVLEDRTVVNFTATAGQILPIRVRRINSTSTTATLLVALYSL